MSFLKQLRTVLGVGHASTERGTPGESADRSAWLEETSDGALAAGRIRERFLERMGRLENFVWLLNRMPASAPPNLRLSVASPFPDDIPLVRRVMDAYRRGISAYTPSDGFWDSWHFNLKRPIHEALAGNDIEAAAAVLRDPSSNTFFWGFDAISSSPEGEPEPHQLVIKRLNSQCDWRELYALWLCDALVSLSEAVGARRADYPEIEIDRTLASRDDEFDVDGILDEIERELGVDLVFPNPFANELGLRSKRGIIGFRSVQSVYQGWRIAEMARGNPEFKVLEIGAGLGRTAYFASLFGVRHYTIVDIPLTNSAQAYFLGRVLGQNNIALGGEARDADLRILSSADLADHEANYDLIVNVDSLTEMPKEVADTYWTFARKATRSVLSINHEFNPHTFRELYRGDAGLRAVRYPYPMRRGYVEEVITW